MRTKMPHLIQGLAKQGFLFRGKSVKISIVRILITIRRSLFCFFRVQIYAVLIFSALDKVYIHIYTPFKEVILMDTAKIFSNGGSQAVRLPKTCRFNSDEVLVNHIGNIVILFPKEDRWQSLLSSLDFFTEDFLSEELTSLPLEDREVIA